MDSPPASSVVTVAVIVPVLNESENLHRLLSDLLERQNFDEVIVVDGGSTDASVETVCKFMTTDEGRPAPVLIQSARGRARQMQAGAQAAGADALLFLHADSLLPAGAAALIRDAIGGGRLWGRFDVRLDGKGFMFRIVERLMNWRSRLTGISTGDQGLFVRRDLHRLLGGFAPLALMEDIEFCQRLKWVSQPLRLPGAVVSSARRWEKNGVFRTILLMWSLRFLYWLGVSPARLSRWYQGLRD